MVNLQAQLVYLREQATQRCFNASAAENPNENIMGPQGFSPNLITNPSTLQYYGNITPMDPNPIGNYENSGTMEESISFSRFEESCDMQRQWSFHEVYNLQ